MNIDKVHLVAAKFSGLNYSYSDISTVFQLNDFQQDIKYNITPKIKSLSIHVPTTKPSTIALSIQYGYKLLQESLIMDKA